MSLQSLHYRKCFVASHCFYNTKLIIMKKVLLLAIIAVLAAAPASSLKAQDKEKCTKECCKKCSDKCKEQCKNGKCAKAENCGQSTDKKSCCKDQSKASS
jgi:hypothetical protein